jgi:phosphoribosylaminoimidazolecarboxamide formyltransferase/IMP cyclohydrolase
MEGPVEKIDEWVGIETALISTWDKSELEFLVPALIELNPNITLLSTGGTHRKIKDEILTPDQVKRHLLAIPAFTGNPEMDKGLVKTLDMRVYAHLLAEEYNDNHTEFCANLAKGVEFKSAQDGSSVDGLTLFNANPGLYTVQVMERAVINGRINAVFVNLYPFQNVVKDIADGKKRKGTEIPLNFEDARGNIDIGGPCMLRASAKNHHRCIPVCNPGRYRPLVALLKANGGKVDEDMRFALAIETFEHTGPYDVAIAKYYREISREERRAPYIIVGAKPEGGK